MTISEAFAFYDMQVLFAENKSESARSNCRSASNSFVKFVGDIPVDLLGVDHVIRWKVEMREDGLKPTSINDYLKYLRHTLKLLDKNEFRVIPWHKVELEKEDTNRKIEWLAPEEVQQLIDAATNIRNKAMVAAYFGTGCRLSELISLDRGDFQDARKILTKDGDLIWEVWVEGKNKKYRPIYYDATIKTAIERYLDSRTDRFKPLFISQQNRRIGRKTVIYIIHQVTGLAGIEKHVTTHTLRHSYVSDLATKGAPLPVVSKLVGHSKVSTTADIYTHVFDTQQQEAYGKYHTNLDI